MTLLQLSAAQGPAECALAVAKAFVLLQKEAHALAVIVTVVEQEVGSEAGTFASLLLSLDGEHADALIMRWCGSLLWVCPSPYRPQHARKNWYFGGERFAPPAANLVSEIRFETLRSSGPGGQHVNTTDSAVRATHLATGISVKVQSERSQHANKKLALLRIALRLTQLAEQTNGELKAARRQQHWQLERGNPVRRFRGEAFLES